MLEQRFYRLEQSITRLEQYASSQRSTGSSSNREVDQMRQELQRMQLRLNEVECGLRRRTDSNGEPRAPERAHDRQTRVVKIRVCRCGFLRGRDVVFILVN